MARYVRETRPRGSGREPSHGRSRGTGQGRYEQLHGSDNGGLVAATIILGALLIISVIATVVAWMGRNSAILDLNELQTKYDKLAATDIHDKRKEIFLTANVKKGGAKDCVKCQELLVKISGLKMEIAQAHEVMTKRQKREIQYNYDIVAMDAKLAYVTGGVGGRDGLQISFTLKNQAKEARGNMLGIFKLHHKGKLTWQKQLTLKDLQPGETQKIQLMAPDVSYDLWECQIYPSRVSPPGAGVPRT
jgi:hypothetical protein